MLDHHDEPAGDLMTIFYNPPRYRTFLLTLWEERGRDPDSPVVWRFRLEDPRTGQQHGFASLETLVAALEQEMEDISKERRGKDSIARGRAPPEVDD